jgi:TonB family protein
MGPLLVFLLMSAFAAAQAPPPADQPSIGPASRGVYEYGSIVDQTYSNECFGFSLPIPSGWQILVGGDGKGLHIAGQLALLILEQQHKEGAYGSRIALAVPEVAASSPTPEQFVSNVVHGQVNSDKEHRELLRDAYAVEYGGKHFYRANSKQTKDGQTLYFALVYTKFREHYLGETVVANSPDALDQAVSSLQSLSFFEDTPNPNCSMQGASGQSPALAGAQRVRVSEKVSQGLLVKKVPPEYPELARQARVQGAVVLRAVIGKNGDIEDLSLVSGHPMLAPAALKAVREWKYKPYTLNGEAVTVETEILVNFSLSGF